MWSTDFHSSLWKAKSCPLSQDLLSSDNHKKQWQPKKWNITEVVQNRKTIWNKSMCMKLVNIVRHVWHDMSGKTHQNGQELAIKREAVRKGSRKEKDSKVGVKASGKQDVEGGFGLGFFAFILFWIHGITLFLPKLVGAHLQTGNKFCSSGAANSPWATEGGRVCNSNKNLVLKLCQSIYILKFLV